jgi:hypothetical protein
MMTKIGIIGAPRLPNDSRPCLELTRFGGRFSYAAFFVAFFTECISSNSIGLL